MWKICPLLIFLIGIIFTCIAESHGGAEKDKSDTVIIEVAGAIREVSPNYLSVALSSQIVRDGLMAELASSKRFVTLSKGLSPAILRVGGSACNFLTYDPTAKNSLDVNPSGYEHDYENVESLEFENFTMSGEDFVNLKNFANAAGYQILFDVNQFYRTYDDKWDPSNALGLIQDADESFLWQLGNEPNSYYYNYKFNFTGTMDAADFLLFRDVLKEHYENPIIVGPDVTNPRFPLLSDEDANSLHMKFLKEFLEQLEMKLSAVTMHQYYLPGTNVTAEDFMSLETLDMLTWQLPQVTQLRDEYAPDTPIWLTETSSSFGGGAEALSNAYVGGFLWLDKLGLSAVMGIDLLARQTLFQKRYALVDNNYDPYPDYWLSLAYKQLVSERVLEIVVGEKPDTTRLYGHCQKPGSTSYEPGNIVIYGVNVDHSTSASVKFDGMPQEHTIEQYLFQPPDGDLQSKQVMLNGQLLEMTSDEELPELLPLVLPQQEFQIPPTTFGLWVIRKANMLDCMYEQ